MNWSTTLGFAVLLLSLHCNSVQSKKHSSHVSKSPWADPVKAKAFMDCLIKKIEQSDVIPQQEKQDMETLVQSLMSALAGNTKGNNSKATLQAMNIAFASALAELVVAEGADDPDGIEVKTNALINILQQCFKKTMHKVDKKFILEIKDLIQMFVKEAAEEMNEAEEDNEFPEDYLYNVEFQTNDQASKDAYITKLPLQQSSGQYPDGGNWGPSGSPSDSSSGTGMTPQRLMSAMGDSQVIGSICRGMKSPVQIKATFDKALTPVLQTSLRLDVNSASRLASSATNGIMSLPSGSSPREYVRVLLTGPLSVKLQEAGILNNPVSFKLFLQTLYGGLINVAANYGVIIPRDAADKDVASATTSMTTATTSIETSFDSQPSGEYPGGQYPDGGNWGTSGSPSDSSSGTGMTPQRLMSAMGDSQVIGSICRGMKSPVQIKATFDKALTPVLQTSLRLDVNSASRLASSATNGIMSLPSGSSPREYVRVLLTGPLSVKLQEAGILNNPVSFKLFLQTLYGGLINVAANYGVIIPRDAADKDVASATTSMTTTITSIQTSFDSQPSGEYPGGQYPDGGNWGPSGSPSDSSSGTGMTPQRLMSAMGDSQVIGSICRGMKSPVQIKATFDKALTPVLQTSLRLDVNSASRLASSATNGIMSLPSGSSPREYVRVLLTGPLSVKLQEAGILNNPVSFKLFLQTLYGGLINVAANYGVIIPRDAADKDVASATSSMTTTITSIQTSFDSQPSGEYPGGQYPDGGNWGPSGSPSDSSSGTGMTPQRLMSAMGDSQVIGSICRGMKSPVQIKATFDKALTPVLQTSLRLDVNSASRLASSATNGIMSLPSGSSPREYVRVLLTGPLSVKLQEAGVLNNPVSFKLFLQTLYGGLINVAANYGVIIPRDAADKDVASATTSMTTTITSIQTSFDSQPSGDYPGGQYPDGGNWGPSGSPSDSSSGTGMTPQRLMSAMGDSQVIGSICRGMKSPVQIKATFDKALTPVLQTSLRLDVNSASRLASSATNGIMSLPSGSSPREYVRVLLTGPLSVKLQEAGILNNPVSFKLFLQTLYGGLINVAANYGVIIPRDAADKDVASATTSMTTTITSIQTSFDSQPSGEYPGGQYPDGGNWGPSGSPSDSSSGTGMTPQRLMSAMGDSQVIGSICRGMKSPVQIKATFDKALTPVLQTSLRLDVNSASRLASSATNGIMSLPSGSSPREYVRVLLTGPLSVKLQEAGILNNPVSFKLFLQTLYGGLINVAANYGVIIPRDAADKDVASATTSMTTTITSIQTSFDSQPSGEYPGGQYPDGGNWAPSGSPSDSSSGTGMTPQGLMSAMGDSQVIGSICRGMKSPVQIKATFDKALTPVLQTSLRLDVNSASRLASSATNGIMSLPSGSSPREYVRVLLTGPLSVKLQEAGILNNPVSFKLFLQTLYGGLINVAANYGVIIPRDAADKDVASATTSMTTTITSIQTSFDSQPSGEYPGGQYPDGGNWGPSGSPSDSSSGTGMTPQRLMSAMGDSQVIGSICRGMKSPVQIKATFDKALTPVLQTSLRLDVNSASRLASSATNGIMSLPSGSSPREYVRVLLTGPLSVKLQEAGILNNPVSFKLFLQTLYGGLINVAANYGVIIPRDAADKDVASATTSMTTTITSIQTSFDSQPSGEYPGGQYPDGGNWAPSGSPSDSSSGTGMTPQGLMSAMGDSQVIGSICRGMKSPVQIKATFDKALTPVLQTSLRLDVNSASRLASSATNGIMSLPSGSSPREYVRVLLTGPLSVKLQEAGILNNPVSFKLFLQTLYGGLINVAANYGVIIPRDAADKDVASATTSMTTATTSIETSFDSQPSGEYPGGQYPDGGNWGPSGTPSDSSSGTGMTPQRLMSAMGDSQVIGSICRGMKSPVQIKATFEKALTPVLQTSLRLDVNSASRLASSATNGIMSLPSGSSPREYVRVLLTGPLSVKLQEAGILNNPVSFKLFLQTLYGGLINVAANYGVIIPRDAADKDVASATTSMTTTITSIQTSFDSQPSGEYPGGQYPDGGNWGPSGSPSDSSSGTGMTPQRLMSAMGDSQVIGSICRGMKSPVQIKATFDKALTPVLQTSLRLDVNSASRLTSSATNGIMSLPSGSSPREYVRVLLTGPLSVKLQEAGILNNPVSFKLFLQTLYGGLINVAANYGVIIPRDAADKDVASATTSMTTTITSIQTSFDIQPSGEYPGGQYPDGGNWGPSGSPSDSSSGTGMTPQRLMSAMGDSQVIGSICRGMKSPVQIKATFDRALTPVLQTSLRLDVNSASRLASSATNGIMSLPSGSSPREYVRVLLTGPLSVKLQEAGILNNPVSFKLFLQTLYGGLINVAANYGVIIPRDAADKDVASATTSMTTATTSIETSFDSQPSGEYPGGQYPDGGNWGPSGTPSDSSSGTGMTPQRLMSAMGDSQVIGSICRGMKSPVQIKATFDKALTPVLQTSLRLDVNSASRLASSATNGIMSLPSGSSPREYVRVLLTGPLSVKLQEAGILNNPVSFKLFLQTLYGGLINVAANYGVIIPRDAADKDVASATTSMTTTITSIQTSFDSQPSGEYPGGQYPDGGNWGPSGSPSDSSSGTGMTPQRLMSAMGDSQVIGSICRGMKSPVQIKAIFNKALTPVLQTSLRLDVNSASRLASSATNGIMSLPSGSSPREYVRVLLTGPLSVKLQEAGILNNPVSFKLFLQTLYGGLINVAANYGVIIPRDAADKDVASATTSMTTSITSIQTSFDSQPSGEYPGGQYPDGGNWGPSGSPSDSSSGTGMTPQRLMSAMGDSQVIGSICRGMKSPVQIKATFDKALTPVLQTSLRLDVNSASRLASSATNGIMSLPSGSSPREYVRVLLTGPLSVKLQEAGILNNPVSFKLFLQTLYGGLINVAANYGVIIPRDTADKDVASATTSMTTTITSIQTSFDSQPSGEYPGGQYPDGGNWGPSGSPSDSSSGTGMTPQLLMSAMGDSQVIGSICRGMKSPVQIKATFDKALTPVLQTSLRLDVNSASRLASSATNGIMSLPSGSSPREYVRVLLTGPLSVKLQEAGILNNPVSFKLFLQTLYGGLINVAANYGVIIPRDAADKDVASATTSMTTTITSIQTSFDSQPSGEYPGGQYPDGGNWGPSGSPSDSSSGTGVTPQRLMSAMGDSQVIGSICRGMKSPVQIKATFDKALTPVLQTSLRLDVNSASRLASSATNGIMSLPSGFSPREYVRVLLTGPLSVKLQEAGILNNPVSFKLFLQTLYGGLINVAANYGVIIPRDAADKDVASATTSMTTTITSIQTSFDSQPSGEYPGGQYPDGGNWGPSGSPSDSSSGTGMTPQRLMSAMGDSQVIGSICRGMKSPVQIKATFDKALTPVLQTSLRLDVNSASRLASSATNGIMSLPSGSSPREYVRVLLTGPLSVKLQEAGILNNPVSFKLFLQTLYGGLINVAANYGVIIPRDAADKDVASATTSMTTTITSIQTSFDSQPSGEYPGGQYPDGGNWGPSGSPSDSSSGTGMTPQRLMSAMGDSQVIGSICRGMKSPVQIKATFDKALTPVLQTSLRLDVNSASRLASSATNGIMSLPSGSSPREYVRVLLTGPLSVKLQEAGILNNPVSFKLFLQTLYGGLINVAANYGVIIPRDAADKDVASATTSMTTATTSIETSFDSQPSGEYPGGQYPDGGNWGPSGTPSDSSSGTGMTPQRLMSAMGDSQVIGSICRGMKSPVQIKATFDKALTPVLQTSLRLDVNSASRLASSATNGIMSLPSGSSPREYVRVLLTGPLSVKLQEAGILYNPVSFKLFLQTLYGGLINVAANYGVIIPRDAADKDVASATTSMTTTITSIQTSFDSQPSGEYPGGQYPDGGNWAPSGSPSDSSSGTGMTPQGLMSAMGDSQVIGSICRGMKSPVQIKATFDKALTPVLQTSLRLDVNSASRLASSATNGIMSLPSGSSPREYVRVLLTGPLSVKLQEAGILNNPVSFKLFLQTLYGGLINVAANYGVIIPRDAADKDVASATTSMTTATTSIETSFDSQPSGEYPGGQYPDGGNWGPSGTPSDSSSGTGMTPQRLMSAMGDSQVIGSICRGMKSPVQIKATFDKALTPVLQTSLRLDVNSASRLASSATNGIMSLPSGSSPREYVRVLLTGPLSVKLQEAGILNNPVSFKLFLQTLYGGLINVAANYGVIIPRDAADKDVASATTSMTTTITSIQTSFDSQPSGEYPGGQYPDGGNWGPSGSPSDSSSGTGMTPQRLMSAMGDSQVIGSICRGMKSPVQIKATFDKALTPVLQTSLRLDVNSASRLASSATNGIMSLPSGSSPREYVRVLLTGPLSVKLQEAGILNNPVSFKLFLQTLYGGLINVAANYGVIIPRDAADKDVASATTSMTTTITSIQTSFDSQPSGEYPGGQYPDGGNWGPSGSPSDSSSGTGMTPQRLMSAMGDSQVIGSICRGMKSPVQIKATFDKALTPVLQTSLRLDVNSASRLASSATNGIMSLPSGSSPREYVRVLLTGPLSVKLQEAGILNNSVSFKLFLQTLYGGLINVAANYGVIIPRDAADKDVASATTSMTTATTSIETSFDSQPSGEYPGGQYPDGGNWGPSDFASGGGDFAASLINILNSRNGLKSPEANLRINTLTSAVQQAIGDDGIKPSVLSSVLRASFSKLKNSGMSSDKATIESLMELITALVNVVGSSRPDPMKSVALSSSIGFTTSLAGALS
nr:aciniform spidroin 2 variant 2 [Araneus ventricosus]